MTNIATTRSQHATWQINSKLDQLNKDLHAVRFGVFVGDLTRPQAAVWFRLLVESTWDEITDLLAFATRGTA